MPDKILICADCKNPFVYSELEQSLDAKNNKPEASYCPVCASIRASATQRPSKPIKSAP